MPLIIPNDGESRDDFLSRCAGDEKMNTEFPDQDQRLAVCANLYDKGGDLERAAYAVAAGRPPSARLVAAFRGKTDDEELYSSWDVEVFAVGKWNGYKFTKPDLEEMVRSFEALHSTGELEVPLKFGHNEEQRMTDGYPALGWIDQLYVKDDEQGRPKLWAKFTDVPKVVYEAAKKKLYRKVSIELEFDVEHRGTLYPYVVTGIALLGADLPAVNTIADLAAYMGRGFVPSTKRASFSAVSGNLKERKANMAEIDDKELEALRAQAAEAEAAKAQVEQFERDKEAREAADQQAKVKAARDNINGVLDQAVTDLRATPAQRAAFAKALKVGDDEAVLKLTAEDVEAMLPEKKPADSGFTYSRQHGDGTHHLDASETDDFLDTEVRKVIAASGGKMTYSRALTQVYAAHPEAARKHLGLDGDNE